MMEKYLPGNTAQMNKYLISEGDFLITFWSVSGQDMIL